MWEISQCLSLRAQFTHRCGKRRTAVNTLAGIDWSARLALSTAERRETSQ